MNDSQVKVGLALGAGGMRGLAHIGVADELQKAGIAFDCLSGCSAGSVIAALLACGVSAQRMEEIALHINESALFDVTASKRGFIKGERFESFLKTLTADRAFCDLDIPLCIVATDYCNARCAYFETGDPEKLYRGVHASCAIPGVFVPVACRNTQMLDGGLITRLPIDECRRLGADVVIGVDVSFSGGTLAVGNVLDIITNSMEILQYEVAKLRRREDDLVLTPRVQHYDVLRVRNQHTLIEEGRAAVRENIDRIRAAIAQAQAKKAGDYAHTADSYR